MDVVCVCFVTYVVLRFDLFVVFCVFSLFWLVLFYGKLVSDDIDLLDLMLCLVFGMVGLVGWLFIWLVLRVLLF